MLEELCHWLRIEATPAARQLGFRREAAALRTRHRRCAAAWRDHLWHTRAALLASAHLANPGTGGLALVLGAGLPRDVPWRELLTSFDEVVLADVVFHPEARAARRQSGGRVRLAAVDVTGCLARLTTPEPRLDARRRDADPALLALAQQARWVASVNLLTQLAHLPCAWLRAHGHDEQRIERFAVDIMQDHLALLEGVSAGVCLVAEEADRVYGADGALVEEISRKALLQPGSPGSAWRQLKRWQWRVNPPGELSAGLTECREVVALHRDGATSAQVHTL